MSLQYLKKEVSYKIDFLHADKHQSFLQIDFDTFDIKVSYKMILSSRILKVLKITSLQYFKKEVRNGVNSLHVDSSKFLQVDIIVFDRSANVHVQSTQNRKLEIFCNILRKKYRNCFFCSIVMQNIQIFYGGLLRCYLFWRARCCKLMLSK